MIVQTTFSCPLNASLSGDARCRIIGLLGAIIGSSLGRSMVDDEAKMTDTLLGADRGTHLKIMAIATASAIAVALVGRNAGVSGSDAAAERAHVSSTVLKAGKPAVSAALDARTIGFCIAGPYLVSQKDCALGDIFFEASNFFEIMAFDMDAVNEVLE
jgi:hypothetical protein